MARPRMPIELQEAKRELHRSKAEIEERKASQVPAEFTSTIEPKGLTKREKDEFWQWAEILSELGILSDLDTDALARYVKAKTRYLQAEKILSKVMASKAADLDEIDQAQKIQDRAMKSVIACAKCLGMTIDSRAKLITPKANDPPKVNKFMEFEA